MTSASELFHNRRSRFGRNSDLFDAGSGLGSPSAFDRAARTSRSNRPHYSHGGSHTRRDRFDPDGCNPFSRARQPSLHRISRPPQERESIRLEEGSRILPSGNVGHSGLDSNVQPRNWVSRTDRLPGAVLLARERLLQRLRGVTISGSRRSNGNSPGDRGNAITIGDDIRLVEAADWETEVSREWLARHAPSTNSASQHVDNRPIGLMAKAQNPGAQNSVHVEVFSILGDGNEQGTPKASSDCSICLESFVDGDLLMCLPCEHRYHFSCMEPWLDTRKDCPYCRRGIDIAMR